MRPASAGRVAEAGLRLADLIANKDREIARLEAAYTTTLERCKVTIVRSARGASRTRTRCGLPTAARVRAERILIATGGWPHSGPTIPGHRARHLLERGVSSAGTAEAHPHPGRRLYRGRVRLHLRRARQRGDAGLSRREHPARLRRRRARASAQRDAARAASTSSAAHGRARSRSARRRISRAAVRTAARSPATSDVRDRPPAERHGLGLDDARRADSRARRHRGRRLFADVGAAHLRRRRRHQPGQSHAGRDPRGPRLRRHACSARSRRRSITPTCRPPCSPSRKSASSA